MKPRMFAGLFFAPEQPDSGEKQQLISSLTKLMKITMIIIIIDKKGSEVYLYGYKGGVRFVPPAATH